VDHLDKFKGILGYNMKRGFDSLAPRLTFTGKTIPPKPNNDIYQTELESQPTLKGEK
jgi:hypothetical protein